MKPKNKGYVKLYWEVLEKKDLTPSEKLAYCVIDSLSSNGRTCYISDKKLAARIGLKTSRQAQRIVANLEAKGLVERNTRNGHRFLTCGNSFPPSEEVKFQHDGSESPIPGEVDVYQLYKEVYNEKEDR